MTFQEALNQHYVAGFVLRRRRQAADGFYLADYRTSVVTHTTREEDAEFFLRAIDANEMALRLRHVTGYAYDVETVGTTVPGPAPRCCGAEAKPCEPCQAGCDESEIDDLAHDIGRELVANQGAGGVVGVCPDCRSTSLRGDPDSVLCLDCGSRVGYCQVVADTAPAGQYHWPEDEQAPLTAEDAFNAAVDHFRTEGGDEASVELVRTAWGFAPVRRA